MGAKEPNPLPKGAVPPPPPPAPPAPSRQTMSAEQVRDVKELLWSVIAHVHYHSTDTFKARLYRQMEPLVDCLLALLDKPEAEQHICHDGKTRPWPQVEVPPGMSRWYEYSGPKTAPTVDKTKFGPHKYPGCVSKEFFTSDCSFGCGCWMGEARSGGDVDPFGACPKNPLPATPAAAQTEQEVQP